MGSAHFPQPPPIDVRSAARAGWRPLVFVPGTRRSSVRKPGFPPPDRGTPALSQEATEADCGRPYSVGLAMRNLERLAICFGDRQAGNGHCMAPEGLSPFLDMEDPTRPGRTTSSSKKGPRSDPKNQPRESALGRPAHSRRTAQTGHRHRRDQRRPVHAAPPQAVFADLADVAARTQLRPVPDGISDRHGLHGLTRIRLIREIREIREIRG